MSPANNEPRVAAVALNWNKREDICRLLDSLRQVAYDNLDVFMVDNGSTDDSVQWVAEHYPDIPILRNEVNLGGTGGFNSGMRHVLSLGDFDYIWLLDNDATVSPDALGPLVEVMETRADVGIAGSRIVDADDPRLTVETGACFRWWYGNVAPLKRNMPGSAKEDAVHDVDYVAICSALIRVSALNDFGLMDERYFLLWDDMDLGVTCKAHGYRVVAVERSVVYHAAFTEKRSPLVDWYYGVRNPLLTFSKHGQWGSRLLSLYSILRRATKANILFQLSGVSSSGRLSMLAVRDFLMNRWGKIGVIPPKDQEGAEAESLDLAGKQVVVLPSGNREEVQRLLSVLRSPEMRVGSVCLLLHEDRAHVFRDLPADEMITFDSMLDMYHPVNLKVFLLLARRRFDCGIHPSLKRVSPFSYLVRTVYAHAGEGRFVRTDDGAAALWKMGAAVVGGELLALVLLPAVWLRSLTYRT